MILLHKIYTKKEKYYKNIYVNQYEYLTCITLGYRITEQLEGGHVGVPGSRDEVGLPIRALPH
jgi:hypothetical protein